MNSLLERESAEFKKMAFLSFEQGISHFIALDPTYYVVDPDFKTVDFSTSKYKSKAHTYLHNSKLL